jgi:hypothetical protein
MEEEERLPLEEGELLELPVGLASSACAKQKIKRK